MNIKLSGGGRVKSKCVQCGGEITFRAKPEIKIVKEEPNEND